MKQAAAAPISDTDRFPGSHGFIVATSIQESVIVTWYRVIPAVIKCATQGHHQRMSICPKGHQWQKEQWSRGSADNSHKPLEQRASPKSQYLRYYSTIFTLTYFAKSNYENNLHSPDIIQFFSACRRPIKTGVLATQCAEAAYPIVIWPDWRGLIKSEGGHTPPNPCWATLHDPI